MSRSTNPSGLRLIWCPNTFEREAYVHSSCCTIKGKGSWWADPSPDGRLLRYPRILATEKSWVGCHLLSTKSAPDLKRRVTGL